ncbi:MAG: class I SAM-dependent methyltransferase [Bacteroidetes bacterium]|nr:class I SAM-dependent methyltransferase [Bacteroidota bacterium]
MAAWITKGDLVDLNQRLSQKTGSFFLSKLSLSGKKRVISTWDENILPAHWWILPQVKQRWNEKITGDPNREIENYILQKYFDGRSDLCALMPGCGEGHLELKFASLGNFQIIEAFDIVEANIRVAKEDAGKQGLEKKINFFTQDIYDYLFGQEKYDLVYFNSSLHHFKNVEKIIDSAKSSLKNDGLLIINEYTGPARFQWTKEQLQKVNKLLADMPESFRKKWKTNLIKKREYRPGLFRMILSDPSEAVESGRILPALRSQLSELEYSAMGGNILHLLLKDIAHNFLEDNIETTQLLEKLFKQEDEFLSTGVQPDFSFGVYQKS